MASPWFRERPQRLERELGALEAAKIGYEQHAPADHNGRLVVELDYPLERLELGESPVDRDYLHLLVRFPDYYPYFRPQVFTRDVELPRHQAPGDGRLCLIGRDTAEWRPQLSLLEHLDQQLGEVLRAGQITDEERLAEHPGEQAEPYSDYFPYQSGAAVLLAPQIEQERLADEAAGRLVLGIPEHCGLRLRASLIRLEDQNRNTLFGLAPTIADQFPEHIGGRWYYLEDPPPPHSQGVLAALRREHGAEFRDPHTWEDVEGGSVEVIGITFPEETRPGQKDGVGWVFAIAYQRENDRENPQGYFARGLRVGPDHLGARVPELRQLAHRTVCVVGLGCIGAPAALEFARSGVGTLRILDHDYVDPGTIRRWPLGLSAAGRLKVDVIQEVVEKEYPYTEVQSMPIRLGMRRQDDGSNQGEMLEEFLQDADLVLDASAQWGVQHLLSHQARAEGIPYIAVAGRQGGWGGFVLRDRPDQPGCWGCYRRHIADGTVSQPPSDPDGTVQPVGCADPTFTGAGFDLKQIALMAVRLGVGTLSRGEETYPDFNWDLGTVQLRTDDGQPVAPQWDTRVVEPHPECGLCR